MQDANDLHSSFVYLVCGEDVRSLSSLLWRFIHPHCPLGDFVDWTPSVLLFYLCG